MDEQPSAAGLRWIGHATAEIDVGGYRILTDPLLRRRVAHLRRRRPLPRRDPESTGVVLLSHAHIDHMHVPSLRLISDGVPVVAPAGTRSLLERAGFEHVVEVTEGDEVEIGPMRVRVTHAEHKSGRGPHSRIDARPVGYVADVGGFRTYFAGDTDLFDDMADLGPIDLALLPIWGWGPTIGVGHLDPERAVEAVDRIAPTTVVPIHWGTYAPENARPGQPAWLDRPAREFARLMERSPHRSAAAVLEPGDSLPLR